MDLEGRVETLENQVTRLNDKVFGPTAAQHLVGLHLNNIARVNQGGWNVLDAIKPTAVLNLPGGASVEDIARILTINPDCHVFIRPYYVPHDDEASKEDYITKVVSMIRGGAWNIIPEGQRHLQLFNEQNMPRHSQYEGFGVNLKDMILFDRWFCIGYDRIKQVDPTWKIGWTPLTPGNRDVFFPGAAAQNTAQMFRETIHYRHVDPGYAAMGIHSKEIERLRLNAMSRMAPCDTENVPYYMHGLEAAKLHPTQDEIRRAVENGPCYQSLMKADEYLAHIYCMSPEHQIAADWAGLRFVMYARFFPKPMDVWIMECGIGGEPHWIVGWYTILQSYPDVKGTGIWKLGAEIGGINPQIAALRTYMLNLPPAPAQPMPWPQPINGDPTPPPDPDPPPSPDLCEEARNTTDAELICVVAADLHAVLQHYHDNGWPVGKPDQQRVVICDWIGTPGFLGDEKYGGTWEGYLVYWGCREAPPEPEPPTVDFYGEPTSGIAPLVVRFSSAIIGQYDAIQWDFGDGATMSGAGYPTHTYDEPGLYAVTLTLYRDGQSFPLTKPGYIEVNEPEPKPPTPAFYAVPTQGTAPLTVQFYNTSVGEYDSLQWDFGDGGSLTGEAEPLHIYTELGLYAVTLTLYQGDKSFPFTKAYYISVLEKPEPEPPKVRRFHIAISGTVTVTEQTGTDEPPIDTDGLTITLREE